MQSRRPSALTSPLPTAVALPERILAIDRFRGALVILMVCGDFLSGVQAVPDLLKHAPDIGFTVADTVAPAFIFAIGLNYGPSFFRHARVGMLAAYRYFGLRYLALLGIGALIAAGGNAAGTPTDWGVLQAIGVAGLICLPLIRLPASLRFVVGVALLAGYQLLLDASWLETVLNSSHGGFFGAISWSALLILSTAVADIWRRGTPPFAICCTALTVLAGVSAFLVPVSKNRVSLSYILITLAISAVVFLLVDLGSRIVARRAGLVAWWGESPLALYMLHLMVLAIFVLPTAAWWYTAAPIALAAVQAVAILAVLSVAAWWLHRRRWAGAIDLDDALSAKR